MYFYEDGPVPNPYGAFDSKGTECFHDIKASSKKGTLVLLTELLQMVGTVRLGHGCDGHQGTWILSEGLAQGLLPEVDLLGVYTSFQGVKVSLDKRRSRSAYY